MPGGNNGARPGDGCRCGVAAEHTFEFVACLRSVLAAALSC